MTTTDFMKRFEQAKKERAATVKAEREEVLQMLKAAEVQTVEAEYSGYGDSGNVDDITLVPVETNLSDDRMSKLTDYIWSFAYNAYPGFEINEGGEGSFSWCIKTDKISLEHGTHHTATEWETQDGL